ncbi:MAG: BlaI/MecI/CopY family transcriptional regulator [Planctomycetota bacterium]
MIGELQLQVMEVIWDAGDATVAEVHTALQDERPLAYTTVLSTMRGLERRGYLAHTKEGKAHRFHARVSRDEHTRVTVDSLVTSLFRGQPEQLMSHLLGDEALDQDAVARIRKLLDEEAS